MIKNVLMERSDENHAVQLIHRPGRRPLVHLTEYGQGTLLIEVPEGVNALEVFWHPYLYVEVRGWVPCPGIGAEVLEEVAV